ncbi:hypothetical protein NUU61_008002 [Penicillium alfredii]|uniref:DUF7703 domain-containing protein n=1 Tax=Penicillium alfredii TaxID=1506179 RepID=A0A9W9ERT0_9EURO|nr:uncharacterized protein NUU61_008002 [Penicillium alfredii]KAJ5086695.1 hypothetical protein NUU61_008002 [Penicillium alfredii]
MSSDLSGGKFGHPDRSPTTQLIVRTTATCLVSISWYNALELIVVCFSTFKRYGGCYFWCLLVASISIIPFSLGYFMVLYNVLEHNLFPISMELVAWIGMVTGQSLVLWSRLHLVVQNHTVLRATLVMIIVNTIIFHVPAAVLELGSHSNKSALFTPGFNIFERIQLIAFSIQEIVLSLIYSWEAVRMLNLRPRGHYKSTLIQLLIVNLAMICMDAAIIGVQYSGYFDIHVTLKAMAYSVKLKLEYAILGKLVHFTEVNCGSSTPTDLSDFVDLSFHPAQPPDSESQARIACDTLDDSVHHRVRAFPKRSSSDPQTSTTSAAASAKNVDLP